MGLSETQDFFVGLSQTSCVSKKYWLHFSVSPGLFGSFLVSLRHGYSQKPVTCCWDDPLQDPQGHVHKQALIGEYGKCLQYVSYRFCVHKAVQRDQGSLQRRRKSLHGGVT